MPKLLSLKLSNPQIGGGDWQLTDNFSGEKSKQRLVLLGNIETDDGNQQRCVMKIFSSYWVKLPWEEEQRCIDNLFTSGSSIKLSDKTSIVIDDPILNVYRHEEYIYRIFKELGNYDPIVKEHVLGLLGSGEINIDIQRRKTDFTYGGETIIPPIQTGRGDILYELLSSNNFITATGYHKITFNNKFKKDVKALLYNQLCNLSTISGSERQRRLGVLNENTVEIILKPRYIITDAGYTESGKHSPEERAVAEKSGRVLQLGNIKRTLLSEKNLRSERGLPIKNLGTIFIETGVKVLNHLYTKYQFCHSDLHRNNVGINISNGNFIIFDFDLSTININAAVQVMSHSIDSRYILKKIFDINTDRDIPNTDKILRTTQWIGRVNNVKNLISAAFKTSLVMHDSLHEFWLPAPNESVDLFTNGTPIINIPSDIILSTMIKGYYAFRDYYIHSWDIFRFLSGSAPRENSVFAKGVIGNHSRGEGSVNYRSINKLFDVLDSSQVSLDNVPITDLLNNSPHSSQLYNWHLVEETRDGRDSISAIYGYKIREGLLPEILGKHSDIFTPDKYLTSQSASKKGVTLKIKYSGASALVHSSNREFSWFYLKHYIFFKKLQEIQKSELPTHLSLFDKINWIKNWSNDINMS